MTLVKTWKVSAGPTGISLTLNGETYNLGASAAALQFELAQAVDVWAPVTPVETRRFLAAFSTSGAPLIMSLTPGLNQAIVQAQLQGR